MSVALRSVMNLVAAGLAAALLLMGTVWLRDRTRRWEEPRWPIASIVPLRARPAGTGPIRLVAINLRCARCVASLRRCCERGLAADGALGALIVDAPVRPRPETLKALPPLPVWWDRDGVWRRRWGHRLYGEVIEFDATGRFAGTRSSADLGRVP